MDCVHTLYRTAAAEHARKTLDASLSSPYYYILHYYNECTTGARRDERTLPPLLLSPPDFSYFPRNAARLRKLKSAAPLATPNVLRQTRRTRERTRAPVQNAPSSRTRVRGNGDDSRASATV